ncbi:hypothetical protein CEXT_450751, partial [Caerostris extrusa]
CSATYVFSNLSHLAAVGRSPKAFFEDRQLLSLTAFAHCCCSSLPPEIDPTPPPSRLSHQLLCT